MILEKLYCAWCGSAVGFCITGAANDVVCKQCGEWKEEKDARKKNTERIREGSKEL
jgi:hypothetical protein